MRLFKPIDIASLVYFRIVFGLILAIEVVRFFVHGWIQDDYIDPVFHFTYFGFEWVKPWPGIGMYLHFLLMGAAALFMAAGLFYRVAACVTFLTFTYVFLLEQAAYLNHWYLMCLLAFLMIFIPAHRGLSVDAMMRRKLRSDYVPAWTLWLLLGQLSVVYIYGGIAKLNGDWMRGEPMRAWLMGRTDIPVIGPLLDHEWFVLLLNHGGLAFDLFIVPLLLWRRTRWFALIWAAGFHLLNSQFFNIGVFPWLMLAATLLYFPPEWPRKLWRLPRRRASPVFAASPVIVALIAVYVLLQVLVPIRYVLYPGSVHWTEEGHRFAWHMKLRSKNARAKFFVTDPAANKTWEVKPRDYLTSFQASKMPPRPDMILQFAHFLARQQAAEKGIDHPLEVRVLATASLHGREKQLLIDPSVNLATERRSLAHARWIVPLATGDAAPDTLTDESSDAPGTANQR